MVICLAGAHGSGKSTLATYLADGMGLPYYPSKAGEIHRKYGVTASDHLPFDKRLDIQVDILSAWLADFTHAQWNAGGVFDRTPADMLAYLLADVQRGSQASTPAITLYRETCMNALARIEHLLLVDPLPHNLADRGADKPDAQNIGFVWHHHYLVSGIVAQAVPGYVRLGAGTVEQRVAEVMRYLSDSFERQSAEIMEGQQGRGKEQETDLH